MDLQAIRAAYELAQPYRQNVVGGDSSRSASNIAGATPEQTFGQTLDQAIQGLNNLQTQADDAIARLAAGEDVDLHQVLIQMEQADIGFRLALQVRSKLVEAYQEIMRMQV